MKHLFLILILTPFFSLAQYSTVSLEERPIRILATKSEAVLNWNESQPLYNSLNQQAKELLYWTNYARKNPKAFWDSICAPVIALFPQLQTGNYALSLKRDLYKAQPLPYLRLNDTLINTAKAHAQDIGIKQGEFSHNSTNGTTFQQRFKSAGLKHFGAENISLGSGKMLLSLVMLYLDHGLDYPGHRVTLLNPDYTDIGIGLSKYGDTGSVFMVQDFSSPQ